MTQAPAPAAPISLRRTFIWSVAGTAIYGGAQWGMLIALAKLGSAEMTGRFALAFAVTAPVFMFANLQLRSLVATDAAETFRFRDYVTLRLVTAVLATGLVAVFASYAGYGRETALVIIAVAVAKAFESMSDIYYGAWQRQDRTDRIATSLAIKGALSLGVLSTLIYVSGSVLLGTIGLALSWGITLAFYDIPAARRFTESAPAAPIAPGRLLHLTRLGLPLGLVTMFLSLKFSLPRLVIEEHLGEAQLGIFAAMAYVTIAAQMVLASLGQSAAPRLAKYHAARDYQAFRGVLMRLLAVGVGVGAVGIVVAIVAGREILVLLYRPEYAGHANVFLILVTAAGLGYVGSILGYALTASRHLHVQIPLSAGIAGLTVLGCVVLVPRYGLRGAAVAELVAMTAHSVGLCWLMMRALKELKHGARV